MSLVSVFVSYICRRKKVRENREKFLMLTLLESRVRRFVFFDIETQQEADGRHVPNCLVADVFCSACMDANVSFESEDKAVDCECVFRQTPLDRAGSRPVRQHTFTSFNKEESPVRQFLRFLSNMNTGAHTTLLSHNGGKFDTHLVLEELTDTFNIRPQLIINGLKIYR